MFARRVTITIVNAAGEQRSAPLSSIDNFAMRNFTNDAIFDDTLPLADGLLEIGNRVPVGRLTTAMQDWFCRKSYLAKDESLRITELSD